MASSNTRTILVSSASRTPGSQASSMTFALHAPVWTKSGVEYRLATLCITVVDLGLQTRKRET